MFVNTAQELLVSDAWKKEFHDLVDRINKFLQFKEIPGEKQGISLLYLETGQRIVLARIEKKETADILLRLGGAIGKKFNQLPFDTIDIVIPPEFEKPEKLPLYGKLMEGLLLGAYRFELYKKKVEKSADKGIKNIQIKARKTKQFDQISNESVVIAESTNLARDWSNTPGNDFTPKIFQQKAKEIAKETGLRFESLDEKEMQRLGMHCFLGVSQGSTQPAFLNILEYQCGKKDKATLLLVGKGLTFDSGGISLKPVSNMSEMKFDMCGGAAVLAAMRIIGLLKPEINVIGMIPASENLPDGKALKPGDILKAFNGKTVEIESTDAEGRLLLADTLAYGIERYKPDAVIDIATLTGGCVIALGKYNSGIMSNNPSLLKKLTKAGKITGDTLWELPMDQSYEKSIEGKYADLKNSGGKNASAITAGIFLRNFVGKSAWAHIDIAGPAWDVPHVEFYPETGATGVGVRLLWNLARHW